MSFIAIFECIIPWFATVKMLSIYVAANSINNTTSWLAYASWTWEVLRRNPDYITYYKSLKNKGLETHFLGEGTPFIIASQGYPTAKKAGLLFPADPSLDAHESHAFWHPNSFRAVVRFHVIDEADIDRRHEPIQLSKFPAKKVHYLDSNGTYHIRLLGENFWFQLQCDGLKRLDENAYIGLETNRADDPEKRLKTLTELYGIYNGNLGPNDRLHVPARLESHQRAMIAYDIWLSGGTRRDMAKAIFGPDFVDKNPEKLELFKDRAKHAKRRGDAYIYGDYLDILDKQ